MIVLKHLKISTMNGDAVVGVQELVCKGANKVDQSTEYGGRRTNGSAILVVTAAGLRHVLRQDNQVFMSCDV